MRVLFRKKDVYQRLKVDDMKLKLLGGNNRESRSRLLSNQPDSIEFLDSLKASICNHDCHPKPEKQLKILIAFLALSLKRFY